MHKELESKKILPLLVKFSIPSTIAILIAMEQKSLIGSKRPTYYLLK